MKIQNIVLSCFFSLLLTTSAQAGIAGMGILLEPAVTYEIGSTKVTYPSPVSDSKGKPGGFGLGARVGLEVFDSVFVGVDGRYSMPKYKDSSLNYESRAKAMNWGPVAGIQTPILGLRVWGSYLVAATMDPDGANGVDLKFSNGSGYRFGAGFRFFMISANLEYQYLKYKDILLEKIGPFTAGTTLSGVTLVNNSWVASVSFPLNF